jgi:hypothetical protein
MSTMILPSVIEIDHGDEAKHNAIPCMLSPQQGRLGSRA